MRLSRIDPNTNFETTGIQKKGEIKTHSQYIPLFTFRVRLLNPAYPNIYLTNCVMEHFLILLS